MTCLRYSIFLLASSLLGQAVNPVSIEPPQKITIQRGQSATVTLRAKIETGYHVNSNTPHEDYLIPLRLTMQADPLQVESVKYPKPHDQKYSFSEKPLSVLTGNFDVMLTLKAPATAKPEMQVLSGKLRYQACSETACLIPKTIEVRVTADVR